MNKEIILNCKNLINTNQTDEFKNYVLYIITLHNDYRLPYEYIFQQIYIHACLKKNAIIMEWLKIEVYEKLFDVIQKTALRQMFIYGNYIYNK